MLTLPSGGRCAGSNGELPDLEAAITAYRSAAETRGASPLVRASAARRWGLTAASGGRWREAVTGFETAVELVGQVAPRSSPDPIKRHC